MVLKDVKAVLARAMQKKKKKKKNTSVVRTGETAESSQLRSNNPAFPKQDGTMRRNRTVLHESPPACRMIMKKKKRAEKK